jgi:oligo-1,6-glucosidase
MYEDVQTRWQYENVATKKSPAKRLQRLWRSCRDSARTPMQWDNRENAGFTTGTPWFYVNQNYKEINVAQQEHDPDSILNFYREAIRLRKSLEVVRHGTYEEFDKFSSRRYVYARHHGSQRLLVVCSFSEKEQSFTPPREYDLNNARLILNNYPQPSTDLLRPYEVRVYLWE